MIINSAHNPANLPAECAGSMITALSVDVRSASSG
jgi:hypothetical protein